MENIKENIKISAKERLGLYELKWCRAWFDEKCLRFLYQRKQTNIQQLKDPNQSNVVKLNNVTLAASRHFRNKKKEYLKVKLMNLNLK